MEELEILFFCSHAYFWGPDNNTVKYRNRGKADAPQIA